MMWVSLVQNEEGSNILQANQGIQRRIARELLSVCEFKFLKEDISVDAV